MTINVNVVIAGALAFTIALAWNEAVSKSIKSFFPIRHEADIAKVTLIYAILITIFIIIFIYLINKTKKIYYQYTGKILFGDTNNTNNTNYDSRIIKFWEPSK